MITALLRDARPPGATSGLALTRVTGTAQPGAAGVLRAPMSGAACVWYRTIYVPVRRFRGKTGAATQIPRDLTSSAQLPLMRYTGPNGMQPRDDVSPVPFVVRGPDGDFVVHPGALVDTAVQSVNDTQVQEQALNPVTHDEYVRCEWIIPVGAGLLAIGLPGRDPDGRASLCAPNGAPVVVTTGTKDELLTHAGAAVDDPSAMGVLGAGHGANLLLYLVALALVTVLVIVIAVLRH